MKSSRKLQEPLRDNSEDISHITQEVSHKVLLKSKETLTLQSYPNHLSYRCNHKKYYTEMSITRTILVMKLIILKTTKTMLLVIREVIEILDNARETRQTSMTDHFVKMVAGFQLLTTLWCKNKCGPLLLNFVNNKFLVSDVADML